MTLIFQIFQKDFQKKFFFVLHFFSTIFFVRKSDFAHISALGASKTIENRKSGKLALCGMYSKSRFYHQNIHPTSSFFY